MHLGAECTWRDASIDRTTALPLRSLHPPQPESLLHCVDCEEDSLSLVFNVHIKGVGDLLLRAVKATGVLRDAPA